MWAPFSLSWWEQKSVVSDKTSRTPSMTTLHAVRWWLYLLLAVTIGYAAVFGALRGVGAHIVEPVMRNVASLVLAAALAWPLLRRATRQHGWRMWASHMALGAAFTLLWSWLLSLTASIGAAQSITRFGVAPLLSGPAAEWQLLQGLFAYAALTGWLAAQHTSKPADEPQNPAQPAPRSKPLLVRADDELVALDPAEIACILGADDYAEVVLGRGTRLVRTNLTEFEDLLDPTAFVRVHRSAIVNLAAIDRAEPAGGGRLTVHLRNGRVVQASRNGARLLRARQL